MENSCRALLVGLIAAASAYSAAAAETLPRRPLPARGCTTCRETRPVLGPEQIPTADGRARRAYAAVQRLPDLVDSVRCFCGCEEEEPQARHVSLLSCFTSLHAANCDTCLREALLIERLHRQGVSRERIRTTVERRYRKGA